MIQSLSLCPAWRKSNRTSLLSSLTAKNRVDAVFGGLAERFADEVVAKRGGARSRCLGAVVRSIGPLLWAKGSEARLSCHPLGDRSPLDQVPNFNIARR